MLRHVEGADMLDFGPADDEIARLNASHGVVERRLADVTQKYNPNQRVTLPASVAKLGAAYGIYKDRGDFADDSLGVSAEIMAVAHADVIRNGLWFGRGDTRFSEARKRGHAAVLISEYGHPGIVFPEEEYTKFPHRPPKVTDRVVERTRHANNMEQDRAVAVGREYRSDPHMLTRYVNTMNDSLLGREEGYPRTIRALKEVLVFAALPFARPYFAPASAKHLDECRLVADRAIHAAVESACSFISYENVDQDTEARLALHRAVMSRLYHGSSHERIASNWRELAGMALDWTLEKQMLVTRAERATVQALGKYATAIPVGYRLPVDQSS